MYAKIRERTKDLKAMRDKNGGNSEGVEQIQLQPVDPGTTISIIVPPEHSDDEDERKARAVFESFSPALQKALVSGSLDAVNEVLATMSVEEAEDVVAKLGGVSIFIIYYLLFFCHSLCNYCTTCSFPL
jgi:cell division cycle protein 37